MAELLIKWSKLPKLTTFGSHAGYIQGRVILYFWSRRVRVVLEGGLYSRAGSVTGFTHTWTATIENIRSCKDFSNVWGVLNKRNWKTPKIWISELFSSLLVTLDLRSDRDVIFLSATFEVTDANFWVREVAWVRSPAKWFVLSHLPHIFWYFWQSFR